MRYLKVICFAVFFAVSSSAFSDEDMVEKAWACEPYLGKGQFVSIQSAPADIFQFAKCNELSEEDENILREALIKKYAEQSNREWNMHRFVSAEDDRKIARNMAVREEKQKREEAAKAEAAKAREAEISARQQQLRSGAIKPESMKDVWLANDQISSLQEIMASTLLRADNAVYGGRVTIEGEEREEVLRAKFDSDSVWDVALQNPWQVQNEATSMQGMMLTQILSQNGTRHYAQLNLNKKSISFARNLRIGSVVWVVGRYKANRKYRLTNMTEGTMPVLDVQYIGE